MNIHRKTKAAAFLTLALMLVFARSVAGADLLDHGYNDWGVLLTIYTKEGIVDYPALKQSPETLELVLKNFQIASQEQYSGWTRDQKIAFWINVYNYSAMNLVIEHYPVQRRFGWKTIAYPDNSIQQISNAWSRKVVTVLNGVYSLNEIEHQMLRKEFKEPRIHFALVCAAMGCPMLRGEPYRPEDLDEQLNNQIRQFLSSPKKFRYDKEKNKLYLSPIFKWFRKDFDAVDGIVSFVKKYASSDLAISENPKIKWLGYDWNLNEDRS